jgi:membrane protease subunit (stomatin/prohibitin family)
LRAFGTYGIRVTDPGVFLKEIVGTDGQFTTEEIEGQLRSMLVAAFTAMLATAQVAALDLAANYKVIGDKSRGVMEPEFQKYGVSLTLFLIENISLPPEVEKMLDTRAQMGLVGDMGRFTQFQTAQAIPEAAKSGGAGDFMGMGVGVAMGQQMGAAMASSLSQTKKEEPSQAAQPQASGKFCSQCGKPVSADAKFCPECGSALKSNCPKCGKPNEPAAKFCQECGEKLK